MWRYIYNNFNSVIILYWLATHFTKSRSYKKKALTLPSPDMTIQHLTLLSLWCFLWCSYLQLFLVVLFTLIPLHFLDAKSRVSLQNISTESYKAADSQRQTIMIYSHFYAWLSFSLTFTYLKTRSWTITLLYHTVLSSFFLRPFLNLRFYLFFLLLADKYKTSVTFFIAFLPGPLPAYTRSGKQFNSFPSYDFYPNCNYLHSLLSAV